MVAAAPFSIIDLNDSEIRVAGNADIVLRSPGYAIVDKDGTKLGDTALHLARLNPRAVQNHYWLNLNQDPLQSPTARVRHNADLAYAHLLAIHQQAGKPDNVLFAVPGYYSNEQLSLLLGLVEASPFNAIGLVDSAIAAAAPHVGPGRYVHAEIHLHHTVVTYMDVVDDVKRTSVQIIEGAGLATVMDDCAGMIADLFISKTRFDPQHHAETEQSLYDRIGACLLTLGSRTEAVIEIPYQETTYAVKLPRLALLEALQPVYRRILGALPVDGLSLVGDRLAGLPGFVEQVGAGQVLTPDSVFQGCRQHIERIRSAGSALNFVTSLPAKAVAGIEAPSASPHGAIAMPRPTDDGDLGVVDSLPVTHILAGHRAYPLGDQRLYLLAGADAVGERGEHAHGCVFSQDGQLLLQAENGQKVFVNGRPVSTRAALKLGDNVTLSGSKTGYSFINVKR